MDPFFRYTPRQQADVMRQLSSTQEELRESRRHSKSLTDALAAAQAREQQVADEAAALRNKLAAAKPEEVEDVVEALDEIEAEDDVGTETGENAGVGTAPARVTIVGGGEGGDMFPEFPDSLKPLPTGEGGNRVCGKAYPNTELWGDVVRNGYENVQDTAAACCESCRAQDGIADATKRQCLVWVWNPINRHCWLKFDAKADPGNPHATGPHVEWTSGVLPRRPRIMYRQIEDMTGPVPTPPTCLHTVLTSSGNAYMNWQTRIMYETYKKYAVAPGSVMKAFTRVLHRGKDDELMMEVPSMRFEPNQANCDTWCDYPVADRSLAIAQWSKTTDSLRCSHVMMVETDYIYIKTAPQSILLPPGQAIGFQYSYIYSYEANMRKVVDDYYKDNPDESKPFKEFRLPQTGNAPSCLNVADLRRVAPLWAEFVARTQKPESLRKALGWLRDMYAYDAAALVARVDHSVAAVPETPLMAQPPADDRAGNAFILHYTWGPEIYDKADKKLWMFDKRAYGGGQYMKGPYPLTKLDEPPVWDPAVGLQLQTFFQPRALSESKLELIRVMVREFNEAVGKLPRIPKGHTDLAVAQAMAASG